MAIAGGGGERWGTVREPEADATPEDEAVADEATGSESSPRRPRSLDLDALRDRLRELNSRVHPRLRRLWTPGDSRFEPGPLGLLGMMLAAMAITLLVIRSGAGAVGGDGLGPEEPVAVPGPPDGELRIMLVGDSATQGSAGDRTWRYHLWSHLREQGVDFDFVGPRDDVYSLDDEEFGDQGYAIPDFDTDHAALWGATARELSEGIAMTAAEHDPQYLLVLAGTEDILAGGGADHALEGIAEIVSTVRVVVDEARFVVGELPKVDGTDEDDRVNAEIDRFNAGLVDLSEQLSSSGSPMIVARTAEDYAPAYDNWDATHPNARGELKIAAAFADALAGPLSVGEEGFPRPLPDLPLGPLTAPEPESEETEDGLLLSWEAVPGATDYRVVQRRLEPEPDDPFVLPIEVERDDDERSILVDSLFSGARYEFTVRTYRGRDEGAASEPLRLTWDDDPPPGPTGLRVEEDGTVAVWDEVDEAGHYEVWVRRLECVPLDRFHRPVGQPRTLDDERPEGEAPQEPVPSPSESPEPPRPDPPPPVAEPPPAPPAPPVRPDPDPGRSCFPRDDRGPEGGEGWRSLGSQGDATRWPVSVPGPVEIVVRSHRDHVEGGFSGVLVLAER